MIFDKNISQGLLAILGLSGYSQVFFGERASNNSGVVKKDDLVLCVSLLWNLLR